MKNALAVCLLCLSGSVYAQQPAAPPELLGQPFYVKTIWPINGKGSWDFVKIDPAYRRLFIARDNRVQSVDIETGLEDGVIRGTRNARAIALDDREEFGYISGGKANEVQAFDRRTLKIVARIPTGPEPRALVYEPTTQLLFAICSKPPDPAKTQANGAPEQSAQIVYDPGSYVVRKTESYYVSTKNGRVLRTRPVGAPNTQTPVTSVVTVIDAETWTPLAAILLSGRAGFAESDGRGHVFINIVNQNAIVRLEAEGIRNLLDEKRPVREEELKYGKNRYTEIADDATEPLYYQSQTNFQNLVSRALQLDWTNTSLQTHPPSDLWRIFGFGKECAEPQSLTVDGPHLRLFVACNDQKLSVVNADTGAMVAKTPTGSGTGVVEYDSARNLIYAANGFGTLTIIHQHVTDSYQVVQNLDTGTGARVLAVNPSNGEVYVIANSANSGLSVLVVGR